MMAQEVITQTARETLAPTAGGCTGKTSLSCMTSCVLISKARQKLVPHQGTSRSEGYRKDEHNLALLLICMSSDQCLRAQMALLGEKLSHTFKNHLTQHLRISGYMIMRHDMT